MTQVYTTEELMKLRAVERKLDGILCWNEIVAHEVLSSADYYLECFTCGKKTTTITMKQFATYLASGWPTCCGKQSSLEKMV